MTTLRETIKQKPWIGWILFLFTIIIVFLIGLLMSSIIERRTEARLLSITRIEIPDFEPRNAVWGINYPKEYETYMQTADTMFQSRHNGSVRIDMLERYPNLVILWAGYGFSKDYNQSRGHYYSVLDVYNTLRTGGPTGPDDGPMPSTCWTCKSPDVPRVMSEIGAREVYSGKWSKLGHEIVNPIGCADCHDPKSMDLQITRPALIEAYNRMGKNINEATHQEMRSLVCAQCHVEYYFNNQKPYEGVNYLTFPWDRGFRAEDMEAYYDEVEFSDWTHALSRTPLIKAQHPDYEIYLTGIHAQRGVSCADCHMPYRSEGGVKFTNHKIQSPLNNISGSCQVCHRQDEKTLTENVYTNMDKVIRERGVLEQTLAKAHIEAKFAWDRGAGEIQMKSALKNIRAAQWRWDFASASHGAAFHAPVETLRIITRGIEQAQEARLEVTRVLAKMGYTDQVPMPDISTKEKAQQFIGLEMDKLRAEKENFRKELLPLWKEMAIIRENGWTQFELDKIQKGIHPDN